MIISLLVAISLSIDCFVASICCGISKSKNKLKMGLTMALLFGIFHFLMPGFGWIAGKKINVVLSNLDHWIAFFLLFLVGFRMIRESFNKNESIKYSNLNFVSLLLLSIATSIDAFIVGMSFALLKMDIISSMIIISLTAFSLSIIGLLIGNKLTFVFKSKAEIVAGLILIAIGFKTLIDHLIR